ncbi:fimbria/pilus outer membrane usher protein [Henriciella aquimarina]|uniref:fimbrial biogenesis outer membrane usher protein n=1 Tax=Henriciella aquimarina TaxID=545261 RepID=UPI0009FEAC60|nr:fimbrial biogenesis outer membrane usher protein [Henriciella aquimarina]
MAFQFTGLSAHAETSGGKSGKPSAPQLSKDASADDIFGALFGTKPQKAAKLPYPVIISGLNQGDIIMSPSTTPGETVVDRKALVDLLLPFLVDEKQLELLEAFSSREQVSTADLNAFGLIAEFDHSNLLLNIDVPIEMRSVIPVAVQPSLQVRNLDTVEQARTSGILNVAAGTQYIHASEYAPTGFAATQVNIDAAMNVRGLVLETGVRYSDTTDSGVVLNDTRLTKDLVDRRIRLQAGDLRAPTSGLQGNPQLLGVAGFRNFGLQPYQEYRTNPSQQFELQRSARVLVYINGQFIREFRLQAGRYNLTDLPLQSAAGNDVVLEIQYDSGDTDRVVFSAFYDFSLLKKGTTDFALSVGPTSTLEDGQREYDMENPALSGFYSRGWSDRLTSGVNFQADTDLVNVGAEAYYSTGLGTFGLLSSYSDHDEGHGGALTGLYRWNDANLSRQTRFDLQLRYQDEDFAALGGASALYKYDIAARASRVMSATTRLQLASRFSQRHDSSDFDQSHSLNFTWRTQYGTLGTAVRYEDSPGRTGWSGGISFNVRIGNGYAQVYHDTRTPSTRASYSSRQDRSVGSLGWDTTYTHQTDSDELRAGATYIGNRFEARAEQRLGAATAEEDFGSENITELAFGSALVFADGATAISRPVYDSFAIFKKNSAVQGFDIAVDPQGSVLDTQPSYAAYSSGLGAAVVPDLNSYYVRTIEVDAPDAPAGTSLGGQAMTFLPGYRSGYIVKLGDDRNVAVMSLLVDENGEPVAFAAGYAITSDGERHQMFTNRGGRFYIDGLKHGEKVRLEFDSPKGATAVFTVPEGDIGVIRMPDPVEIQTEKESAPYQVTVRVMGADGA